MSFADEHGIEKLSMRRLGDQLGVEAMSLYNHVASKDDLVGGIVEMVVSEFGTPPSETDWKAALQENAKSVHETLLRHPWAPALIQSRTARSEVRAQYSEAVIGTLRRAGFSVEQSYRAQLTLTSFVYGFTLQQVNWPFDAAEQHRVAIALQPQFDPDAYPNLVEMLGWIAQTRVPDAANPVTYESDFDFGLKLILNSLEQLVRDR